MARERSSSKRELPEPGRRLFEIAQEVATPYRYARRQSLSRHDHLGGFPTRWEHLEPSVQQQWAEIERRAVAELELA
jgi:hypothetical protein